MFGKYISPTNVRTANNDLFKKTDNLRDCVVQESCLSPTKIHLCLGERAFECLLQVYKLYKINEVS